MVVSLCSQAEKKKLPLVGPPTQIGSACERTLMMIPIICPMIATSRRTFERVGTKQGGLFGKINFVYNNGVDISKHKCFAKLGSLVIYNKTEDDNQYIVRVSFGGAHGPKTHFFQVNSSSWRHVICWRKRSCVCHFVNGRFFTHFSNRNPVMKRSDVFPIVWYHTINIYNYNPWMSWKARVMSCHVCNPWKTSPESSRKVPPSVWEYWEAWFEKDYNMNIEKYIYNTYISTRWAPTI